MNIEHTSLKINLVNFETPRKYFFAMDIYTKWFWGLKIDNNIFQAGVFIILGTSAKCKYKKTTSNFPLSSYIHRIVIC